MKAIHWGVVTLFLMLISVGCMVNNHWIASLVFFGLGVLALNGAQPRGYR